MSLIIGHRRSPTESEKRDNSVIGTHSLPVGLPRSERTVKTTFGLHGRYWQILLQKSQIARRQFSCCKKIRPTTADRCGPNHVTEVASELSLVAFHNEPPPAFRAPPKSCDAHFHIFGPAERYPYGSATTENLRYAPPLAPLSDYLELAKLLGVERFVFVQPSAYGRDNACMLERCRGIVDVDENAPDSALAEMDKLGVRGVRINVSPVKPLAPGFSDSSFGPASLCFVKPPPINPTIRYSRRPWSSSTTANRTLARWNCSGPNNPLPKLSVIDKRCQYFQPHQIRKPNVFARFAFDC